MTTPETIGKLTAAGVIVAAGHTNASYDEIAEAYRARPHRLHPSVQRHVALDRPRARRGRRGASNPDSYCGIIVDGRHVHPEVLKLALRCKPHDRFMLVTDAWPMSARRSHPSNCKAPPSMSSDGVCIDENGTLAGSAMDMSRAVRNAMELLGVSLHEALTMASAAPAAFLGLAASIWRNRQRLARQFRRRR